MLSVASFSQFGKIFNFLSLLSHSISWSIPVAHVRDRVQSTHYYSQVSHVQTHQPFSHPLMGSIWTEKKEINISLHLPGTVILFRAIGVTALWFKSAKLPQLLIWGQKKKLFKEPRMLRVNLRKVFLCLDVLFYSFFCHQEDGYLWQSIKYR